MIHISIVLQQQQHKNRVSYMLTKRHSKLIVDVQSYRNTSYNRYNTGTTAMTVVNSCFYSYKNDRYYYLS
jgi:hypothetical protein